MDVMELLKDYETMRRTGGVIRALHQGIASGVITIIGVITITNHTDKDKDRDRDIDKYKHKHKDKDKDKDKMVDKEKDVPW